MAAGYRPAGPAAFRVLQSVAWMELPPSREQEGRGAKESPRCKPLDRLANVLQPGGAFRKSQASSLW